MKEYLVYLLTENRYLNPDLSLEYNQNIIQEDELLINAFKSKGHIAIRKDWMDKSANWSEADIIIFRTTWNYYENLGEFMSFIDRLPYTVNVVNRDYLKWNLDKTYLLELQEKGINIPSTIKIDKGQTKSLMGLMRANNWDIAILKPCMSAAAFNTFKIDSENINEIQKKLDELIQNADFLVQEYIQSITKKGEISMVYFGGEYSHTILKRAKKGDFRVQDDFGGTVHDYEANQDEIDFGYSVLKTLDSKLAYARIDIVWDNEGNLALSELELIEPELWFRNKPESAAQLVEFLIK